MPALSSKPVLSIDGLEHSRWDREVFEEMRAGKITAVHATLAVWQQARETLDVIGGWRELFRTHGDLIMPIESIADLDEAIATSRTGIIFGFQNTSPFEDAVLLVEEFHRLGVRVAQLTYNIQNLAASSCYEPNDSGLSRFGRNLVAEMNRVGMVIDLSHVGNRSAREAVEASTAPVAFTHANPYASFPHPRNKPDDLMRLVAERGGIMGCAPYPHLTGGAIDLNAWCRMIAHAVDVMGIDHVAIGSDASRKWSDADLMWMRMGRWTRTPEFGAGTKDQPGWAPWPEWFETPAGFPTILAGLEATGFSAEEVAKIAGSNWRDFFAKTWR